jgi:hypothetical protein
MWMRCVLWKKVANRKSSKVSQVYTFWITSHIVSFGYFVVMSCMDMWVGHNVVMTEVRHWWEGPFPVCVQVSSPIYMGKCAECVVVIICWICTKVYSYVLDNYGFDSWWVPWIPLFRVSTCTGWITCHFTRQVVGTAFAISGGWDASGAGFCAIAGGNHHLSHLSLDNGRKYEFGMENQLDCSSNTGTVLCRLFSINTVMIVHLEITIKSRERVLWWNDVRLTRFKVEPWIWIRGFSFYSKCFINVWVYKWLCNPWLNKQYWLLLCLLDLAETMCNGMAIYFHDRFHVSIA